MRMEDMSEPIQKLVSSLNREVTEEEMEILREISVQDLAQIYDALQNQGDPEEILAGLKAKRTAVVHPVTTEVSGEADATQRALPVEGGSPAYPPAPAAAVDPYPPAPAAANFDQGASPPQSTVAVYYLNEGIDSDAVRDFFSFCGTIASVSLQPDTLNPGMQVAFVTYEGSDSVAAALQLTGAVVDTSAISVALPSEPRPPPPAPAGGQAPAPRAAGGAAPAPNAGGGLQQFQSTAGTQGGLQQHMSQTGPGFLTKGRRLLEKAGEKAVTLDQKHGIAQKLNNQATKVDKQAAVVSQQAGAKAKSLTTKKPKE